MVGLEPMPDYLSIRKQSLKKVIGFSKAFDKFSDLKNQGTDFSAEENQPSYVLKSIHPNQIITEVTKISQASPTAKTIRLNAIDNRLPIFQAGQYINIHVSIEGVMTSRPYTISSQPASANFYEVTIKRYPSGLVSNFLMDHVKEGLKLRISAPTGSFYHNPLFHGNHLYFLAGGAGITPASSMIPDLLVRTPDIKITLIHSNSYEHDIIFNRFFTELSELHKNFKFYDLITRPSKNYNGRVGRLSETLLLEMLSDSQDPFFYICGPSPFNKHCCEILNNLEVSDRKILVDINGPLRNPELHPGWPKNHSPDSIVSVTTSDGKKLQTNSGEPLLNALEKGGLAVKNRCRSGQCSLCRVRLVSGKIFQDPKALTRKSDEKFGWIHSCVSYPVSDIEIKV